MTTPLPMLVFLIAVPLAACATAPVPPPVAMAAAPAPSVHSCPKHPGAVSDQPAACPKCGMKMKAMVNQPPSHQPPQAPPSHSESHH